jgi:SAM-dependent methyltransferase
MSQKVFKTSFGHEIPIVANYRRNLPPPRDNVSVESASSIQETLGVKGPQESDFGIVSDIFQFSMLADWFNSTPAAGRRYERMLDVGGSTGFISQMFKATGHVRAAENIEILDFSEALDMDRARYFINKINNGRKELYSTNPPWPSVPAAAPPEGVLSRLVRPHSAPPAIVRPTDYTSREDQFWVMDQLDFFQSTFPAPIDKFSHFWRLDPKADYSLDRYITGDFMELEEQYDFLLVATTMQHFSVPVFLKKAYSLLKPGGVIFIWNAYWYWALIVNRIYGDFPWAVQRLTDDDFARYVREYQPDQVENSRLSVGRFHKAEKRYTVPDYIKAGEAAGFRHLAHHRLRPFSGLKNKIGAWTLEGDHGPSLQQEVLRDIHEFRPDVDITDLTTQSVFLLFQKD